MKIDHRITGAQRIATERRRQMQAEGWDEAHDDKHWHGELAAVAVCYAAPVPVFLRREFEDAVTFADPWPPGWDECWDKRPRDKDGRLRTPSLEERIRMMEKAGALIAAEIDRLLRAAARGEEERDG